MFTKSHHHHIDKLIHLKGTLQGLYMHLVIQALAISMVSVFVPVFLLQQGFSLTSVFTFLFLQWATFGLLAPLSGHIISRIGIKEVIFIRTPMIIASLSLLALMPQIAAIERYYLAIAFMLGLAGVLYTLSISSLFAQVMHTRKAGHETGLLMSLPSMGAIAGPFVGGLISLLFGFPILFIIVASILLISVFPLMRIERNVDHPRFDIKEVIGEFGRHKRQILFLNLYGVRGFVVGLVIPILVYLYSRSALDLGIVSSVISLFGLFVTIKVGDIIDRYGKRKVVRAGAALAAVYFVALALITRAEWFIIASLISGLSTIFTSLPYESYLYENARKGGNPIAFLVFKEMSLFMGRIALFIALIALADRMQLTFYLGSVTSLFLGLNNL